VTSTRGAYKQAANRRLPWWCRTFGHRFVISPRIRVNETRWDQPSVVPLDTYCARCGTPPEPSSGGCTETGEGILDAAPLFCDLREGHKGSHHDAATGADWWKRS
jgi:hypothetical protein